MKQINLSRGYVALVSDEDYERVNQYTWYANEKSHGNVYAARKQWLPLEKRYENISMHRFIMGVVGNLIEIDHRNGNKIDNQRENLRICTHKNNSRNVSIRKGRKYKGVSNRGGKLAKPWRAYVSDNGKFVSLGYFATDEEAARAYDLKARELFGDYAALNYPKGAAA